MIVRPLMLTRRRARADGCVLSKGGVVRQSAQVGSSAASSIAPCGQARAGRPPARRDRGEACAMTRSSKLSLWKRTSIYTQGRPPPRTYCVLRHGAFLPKHGG
eukprot:193264-Pyramimonas_sp.AAC.1